MTELGDPTTPSSRGARPRIFEGRTEHLAEFRRRLNAYAQNPVWQIFGVAGIGKTALLGKFAEVANEKFLPVALLNTDRETKTESDAFQQIASQLGESELPRLRREIALQRTLQNRDQSTRRLIGGYLGELLSLPGIGAARRGLDRHLEATEKAALQQAHERLFKAFTADLDAYLRTPGRCTPAVFLIDTYEDIKRTPLDSLFRRMASSLKKCVFVFASREPLEWEKLPDPDGGKWSRRRGFRPLELDRFTPGEAENYLRRRKVRHPLRERIIEYTNCFPLFLEMAADLAREDAKCDRPLTPDDFPSARFSKELVADFLFNTILERITEDPVERDFICAMGLCRRYDMPLAASLAPGGPGTVQNLLSRLNSYHFVRPLPHDRFTFHDSVRLAADRSFDHFSCPEKRTEARQRVINYHQKRADVGDDDSLLELCYHRFQLDPKGATEFWSDKAEELSKNLRMLPHYRLVMDFLTYAPGETKGQTRGYVLGTAANRLMDATIGDIPQNVATAIRLFKEALTVYTREDFPLDWAMTQNNLGIAYSDLPTGDRAENLKNAIACYKEALTVRTRDDFPVQWAMTQNNLGTAYSDLPTGDRAENLKNAIACYKEALTVRTRDDFPVEWAATQNNLGTAYQDLHTGDRADNLNNSIACYKQALTVYTEDAFPHEHGIASRNLARAMAELQSL